jgi:hypothetical protein
MTWGYPALNPPADQMLKRTHSINTCLPWHEVTIVEWGSKCEAPRVHAKTGQAQGGVKGHARANL